ncbi:tetratricopeptide repeat protein [Candidatus Auribacterota bacterium]
MTKHFSQKFLLLLLTLYLGCGFSQYNKHFKKGIDRFNQGDYQAAIRFFTLSLNINPGYKKALAWRAKTYHKLKDYEKAIKDISSLVEKKKHPQASELTLRADSCFQLNRYKSALKDYNQAISIDSQNSQIYYKRGLLFLKIEAFKRAKSDLKYAIKLAPANEQIYCHLGKYYVFRKQYKKAIHYLTEATKLNPDYAVAHYFLGRAYLGKKNKGMASIQCSILGKLNAEKLKNKLLKLYLKQRDSIWEKRKV